MKEQKKMIAAQRLLSKNIIVICSTEMIKNKLSQKNNILQSFEKETQVCMREYIILAHEIKMTAVNTMNQKKIIAGVYRQNSVLKDKV